MIRKRNNNNNNNVLTRVTQIQDIFNVNGLKSKKAFGFLGYFIFLKHTKLSY